MLMPEMISLESRISTLNNEGSASEWNAKDNFWVTGGSLVMFDDDGAILESAVHDDITLLLKIDSTEAEVTNKKVSAFAFKKMIERETFPQFFLPKNSTLSLVAKHNTPESGTENNSIPIDVKLVFNLRRAQTTQTNA